jgi:hypothetical protein
MGGLTRHAEAPASHRRFVVEKNMLLLGESMVKGVITRNCYESMKRYGMAMPEWWNGVIGQKKIMGPMDSSRGLKASIYNTLMPRLRDAQDKWLEGVLLSKFSGLRKRHKP